MDVAKEFGFHKVAIAGGVAANSCLREKMETACKENELLLYYPPRIYCTDNAAMIASAGYYEYLQGERAGLDLNAVPSLSLGRAKE